MISEFLVMLLWFFFHKCLACSKEDSIMPRNPQKSLLALHSFMQVHNNTEICIGYVGSRLKTSNVYMEIVENNAAIRFICQVKSGASSITEVLTKISLQTLEDRRKTHRPTVATGLRLWWYLDCPCSLWTWAVQIPPTSLYASSSPYHHSFLPRTVILEVKA